MIKYQDKKTVDLLKNASGQLDRIIKALGDGSHGVNIPKQVLGVRTLLGEVNLELLKQHIQEHVK